MTTKQANNKQEKKKEQVTMARSIMLTRFKLSQQKEKKEKETQEPNQEQLKSPNMLKKNKTTKSNKSPKKCKKTERIQNVETAEFHPNKLKRNKAVKKVLLKPKHKLIIIGQTNGSKRKINEFKEEVKTSTPKRKKTACKNSILNSSLETSDGSQSPVYSELGIQEMIRIADENQILTDEDLMEILTCPSPVWWEDPPNENFIEGPLILKSMTIPPSTVVPQRSKHSRKKTPHKIIIEPPTHEEDTTDFITNIDTETLNKKSRTDYKFNNKRSKLENLLSTIKNKLNEAKPDIVPEKEPEKAVDETNKTMEAKKDTSLDSLDEDTLLPDISPLDSVCLEHLENMVIPIEKKTDLQKESQINQIPIDKPKIIKTVLESGEKKTNAIKKNSKGNPINKLPCYIKNKKIKLLNVAKPSPDVISVKRKRNTKGTTPMKKREKQEPIDNKVFNSYTIKNKISPKTRHKLLNHTETPDPYITESDDDSAEYSITDQSNSEGTYTNTKSDFEEYMTVFKIISSDEAQNLELDSEHLEGSAPTASKDVGNEAFEKEIESVDKGKLNSYYKICKNAPKATKIIRDAPEVEQQSKPTEDNVDGDKDICDDCTVDNKSAIVVHDNGDVKYCLKCSSIFDMDECDYCIRKEKRKQRDSQTRTNTECDV